MLRLKKLRSAFFGPVDLEAESGSCVAVMGASGAGKSVLLRAIADLDPNEGEAYCDGEARSAMAAPRWRRLVGLVPAETGWWADRVGDHFKPPSDVSELLNAVGLPADTMDWDVARLSTGERHRLGLLRTLILKPRVLLLDEPTASLDDDAAGQIETLLGKELAGGAAIILVTHQAGQAKRLASRIFVMEKGRLVPAREAAA